MDGSAPRRGRCALALGLIVGVSAFLAVWAAAAATAAAATTPVWVATATGPGGTSAAGAVVARDKGSGALYTAGTARVPGKGSAVLIVKYTAAGVERWRALYRRNGAGLQTAVAGAVDKAGDFVVLCAVSSRGSGADWAVLKYAPDGTRIWATTIAGVGHGNDVPSRLELSSTGAAYAAGGLVVAHRGLVATVAKLTPGGRVDWKRSLAGTSGVRQFSALALGRAGRVLCAGAAASAAARGADCLLAAYSPAGRRLFTTTWGGPAHRRDGVSDLAVSPAGAIYAVGWFGAKAGSQAMIRRFDSGGRFVWQATYAAQGGGNVRFVAAALLRQGRVVATGTLVSAKTGNSNIVTIGFAAKGTALWRQIWDTPHPPSGFSHDRAEDVVVDAAGRVFVLGSVQSAAPAGFDFALLVYASEGVPIGGGPLIWNGGSGDDFARSLTPAPGGVVVSGRSQAPSGHSRMATVKLPY
jgi:hypothetical protein